jgi:hypothetical protein
MTDPANNDKPKNYWAKFVSRDNKDLSVKTFQEISVGSVTSTLHNVIFTPFENLKVKRQLNPTLTMGYIARTIYSEHGVNGFFRGLGANLIRDYPRQFYRMPLIHSYPNFVLDIAPDYVKDNAPRTLNLGIGFSSALIDAAFSNVGESLKTKRMTAPAGNKSITLMELYQSGYCLDGLRATMAKASVFYCTLRFMEYESSLVFGNIYGGKDKVPLYAVTSAVGLNALLTTIITTPIDTIKTHQQVINSPIRNLGLMQSANFLLKQHGPQTFTAGFAPRLFNAFLWTSSYYLQKECLNKWRSKVENEQNSTKGRSI